MFLKSFKPKSCAVLIYEAVLQRQCLRILPTVLQTLLSVLLSLQTWCRGKKLWESEALCLDCHKFSFRGYKDPDFKTPEQYEKERWETLVAEHQAQAAKAY